MDYQTHSRHVGTQIWLKRVDLNHAGPYKINDIAGQTLRAFVATLHAADAERS